MESAVALTETGDPPKQLRREVLELRLTSLALENRSLEMDAGAANADGPSLTLSSETRKADRELQDLGAQKNNLGYVLTLSGDVLFDFDKTDIKPQAVEILSKLAAALEKLGSCKVTITGYTDAIGSEEYNLDLSRRRAGAVKNWLVDNGKMRMFEFTVIGRGEENPVTPNTNIDGSDNPQGRARNRRVEIQIARLMD